MRPYIICHMLQSLDGKVTGSFLSKREDAVEVYYELNRKFKCNGFICGRVTMEESFTGGVRPDLEEYPPEPSGEDFVPEEKSGFYAVSFDPKGRVGWTSSFIKDEDGGYSRREPNYCRLKMKFSPLSSLLSL